MQNAAAFTTIIAEAFMGITTYFVSRKSIRITFHFKTLWKVLLGCAGIALNCYLMKLTIKGNVVYLLAGVISSIVIYALIEVIVKNHVVDEMLQNFISKVKSIRKGKEEKI